MEGICDLYHNVVVSFNIFFFSGMGGISELARQYYCKFSFFCRGGILFLYRNDIQRCRNNKKIELLFVASLIVYTIVFFYCQLYSNVILVGILMLLYTLYAIMGNDRQTSILNNPIVSYLSRISFEIYLCHMLFLGVVGLIHLEKIIHNTDILTLLTYVFVLSLSILFALTYKMIEKRVIDKFEIK